MPVIRIYEDSEITERVMLKGKEESGRGRQRREDGLMGSREVATVITAETPTRGESCKKLCERIQNMDSTPAHLK